jgi:NRPS condensation-like uncharacterized protein
MHASECAGIGFFYLSLEMEFPSSINIERLAKAAELLMDAHPVLGCRLVVNPDIPYWERLDSESRSVLKIAASETEYNEWLTTTINVEAVVPFAIYILHQGSGDRLCLKIQHQVADAGGLKEIAYKLASIYRKLKTEPDWQPEPYLVASRGYDQLTGKIPWYAWLKIHCNFFKYHFRTTVPFRSHSIGAAGAPPHKPSFATLHIAPERVTRIRKYGRVRSATLNDMLVAAMVRAQDTVRKKDVRAAYRLLTTIDFRRWYLPEKHAEDFCNLSGFIYINLGRKLGENFEETLSIISSDTRRQKKDFYGLHDLIMLPLAKLVTYTRLKKVLKSFAAFLLTNSNFMNILTNLGLIDEAELIFEEKPLLAWILPPAVFPPAFGVGFSGYRGGLTISTSIYDCDREIVQALFQQIEAELP